MIQTVVGFGSVTGRAWAAGVPEALVGVKTGGAALGLGRQEGVGEEALVAGERGDRAAAVGVLKVDGVGVRFAAEVEALIDDLIAARRPRGRRTVRVQARELGQGMVA